MNRWRPPPWGALGQQIVRSGRLNSLPAEALLARMLVNIDGMCAERDKIKSEQPIKPKVLGGRSW
jgi:hypothetical protein